MVAIHRPSSKNKAARKWHSALVLTAVAVVFCFLITWPNETRHSQDLVADPTVVISESSTSRGVNTTKIVQQDHQLQQQQPRLSTLSKTTACPYKTLDDLTDDERHPRSGDRHMVQPPTDREDLTLVCCQTSAGPWSIVVHPSWAPLGAERFLNMVTSNYFNNQNVPLMRCVHNFLCQFGLAGTASRQYSKSLPDDPNWLPEGKLHRQNSQGVKRFARGYMAYAGGGKNSRTQQLIVSLKANGPLGGGSPWEVPWGELVGAHSFETLSNIYTGYGEKGPSQGRLHQAGYMELIQSQFPKLDFITSCLVVDEE